MGQERMRVYRKGPKFNCSVMFSYFLKASHLSSFVFKAESNNRCIIYTLTHILYNKILIDRDLGKAVCFVDPRLSMFHQSRVHKTYCFASLRSRLPYPLLFYTTITLWFPCLDGLIQTRGKVARVKKSA